MNPVSIGDVQCLDEAIGAIADGTEAISAAAQELAQRLAAVADEAYEEVAHSSSLLAAAVQDELVRQNEMMVAHAELAAAQSELAAAYSALDACESQEPDEDGNGPNCSSEASAVASAEGAVAHATTAVVTAERAFELAKQQRMRMERRVDLAQRAASQIVQLEDLTRCKCAARLQACTELRDQGHARLAHAQSALDSYLATSPTAAQFAAWLRWQPVASSVVGPSEISSRIGLSPDQQSLFLRYLAVRAPGFRARLAGYRAEFQKCQGPVELHALQLKVRRSLAGEFAERMVLHALRPLAETVTTQTSTIFADGRCTKTDLVLQGLRVPVILGRGAGLAARPGGSLAVEVKCGQSQYLRSEQDHMVFQAGGHRAADASMTICSRDIHDLPDDEERALRDALRDAGSPLIGMLPRKEEIDKVCWEAVAQADPIPGGDGC